MEDDKRWNRELSTLYTFPQSRQHPCGGAVSLNLRPVGRAGSTKFFVRLELCCRGQLGSTSQVRRRTWQGKSSIQQKSRPYGGLDTGIQMHSWKSSRAGCVFHVCPHVTWPRVTTHEPRYANAIRASLSLQRATDERKRRGGGKEERETERKRKRGRETDLTCRRSSSPVGDSRGEYKCYYINPLPQRNDRRQTRRKAAKKGRENEGKMAFLCSKSYLKWMLI